MSGFGVVVIGRNEGERLVRCLRSITGPVTLVYVDSGSTDGSSEVAAAMAAIVVPLDMSLPFTAARARNAGRAALPASCRVIQFVDGDCVVQPDWLETGKAALDADPGLAAVFGRLREVEPDASIYNWMCDVEWAVPPGPAKYFGGNVMMRTEALDGVGGYPSDMIAGEEPDLALRMRAVGWRLACLPAEMMLHDAALARFGQWWRRTVRSGHAFAELAARHYGSPLQDYTRRIYGVLLWGALLPAAGLTLLVTSVVARDVVVGAASLVLLVGLPLAQITRLTLREAKRLSLMKAATRATFLMIAKPAQFLGIARYWTGRVRGKRVALIEYKSAAG